MRAQGSARSASFTPFISLKREIAISNAGDVVYGSVRCFDYPSEMWLPSRCFLYCR